jgi:AcrR family transcriptional regulator
MLVSARRAEIVEIARGLFAEKGYAATSTRDIADACGLLAGSLYSHFRSKGQILELAMAPFLDRLASAMHEAAAEHGTGFQRTEAMTRRVVAECASHPAELRILHYDWPNIQAADELGELNARLTETLDVWQKVLASGVEDATIRSDVQPEVAMRIITSSIHGVLDRQRYGTRTNLLDDLGLDSLTDQLVFVVINGLKATSATTGKAG